MSDDHNNLVFLSVPLHTEDPQVRAIYAIEFLFQRVGPIPLSQAARIAVLEYHLTRAHDDDGTDKAGGD